MNTQIAQTGRSYRGPVFSFFAVAALLSLSCPSAFCENAPADTSQPSPSVKVDDSQLQRSTGAVTSFAPIVDKVAPSVVTVFTSKTVRAQAMPFLNDPMFRRFFGNGQGPNGDGQSGKILGLGSGVIVSADGHILTNNHVAEAGDEIMVRIGQDGREYKAKKIGNDPGTDLAVLKIDAKDLPVITFADSDKLRVGDIVLAVGNPFGLTQSVTMGIVSAIGRGGMGIVDYENFIQTDASINPGNSGGALVDTQGRLVGINTAIFSRNGGNQGIGFAVPSNLARNVMDSILKTGHVSRGYLGTLVQPLTPDLAEAFKLKPDQQGALVAEVAPKSPAEQVGLKNGDIITEVNGKKIKDPRELRLTVGGMSPGSKVELKYQRDGQEKTAQVELAELPTSQGRVAQGSETPQGKSNVLDGITVEDIDEQVRQELKIPNDVQGAIISQIDPDSVGYTAGLRQGDVIQEINRRAVKNADEAIKLGDQIEKSEKVLLHVWSKGKTEYVVLQPKP